MIQFDVITRNFRLEAIETVLGTSPILRIRTGAQPAHCSDPDFGTVIATLPLPVDWMLPAAGGAKSKSGTWQDLYADSNGIAGHFRIYDSGGVCRMQGSISHVGGGGDMTISSVGIVANQYVTVQTFTLNEQNG